MDLARQIDHMTISDKLQAMELLWDELCQTPEKVPSPGWHEEILLEREKGVEQGTTKFSKWASAKEKIRASVK